MTYEEAKMQIQAIPEKIWDQLSEPDREAMEMAFSALQEQEAKAQLPGEGTTSDLISRRVAVDALWEIRQKEISDGRRFHDYCSLSTAVDVIKDLPSAHPEIEERKEESAQNVPKEDLISRKAAIDAVEHITSSMSVCVNTDECHGMKRMQRQAVIELANLPSAHPEIKPISYQDCANAMMMMWIDNVLTDGEYRRIMDKLNDHESGKENR